jgi:beta-N-acetylhexosaminidase
MKRLSRRRLLLGASQAASAAFLAACIQPLHAESGARRPVLFQDLSTSEVKPPIGFPSQQPVPFPDASLDAQVGQMLLVGFGGKWLADSAPILAAIGSGRLGSVVLFGHNIVDAAQLRLLTQTLQAAAAIPLLVSLDQEGGYVSRLGAWSGITPNYSAQYLGSQDNLELTKSQGTSTATVLKDYGINLNLAPVVDLNLNPANPIIGRVQRSYSDNPDRVYAHAKATIDAHRDQGVGCTLKHFPGHGSSNGDTHKGFVDVTQSWQEIELSPYIQLIADGEVDAVMTAHIFNSNLDPALPATLSKPVITGLLREKLQYDGVVMSDDMRMRAISDLYSPEDAILKAVEAGVDIISISNNIPGTSMISADQAFDILRGYVDTGQISTDRVAQSYRRIMALKAKIGLVEQAG